MLWLCFLFWLNSSLLSFRTIITICVYYNVFLCPECIYIITCCVPLQCLDIYNLYEFTRLLNHQCFLLGVLLQFWVLTLHSIAFINSKGLLLRFYVTWQELGYIYCPIYYSRWLFFLVLMVIWVLLPNFFSSVIYLRLWLALVKCVFETFVSFFSSKLVQAWPGDYVTSGFTASYT